jgi:HTH-type transcriptional regulator, sugar sensing transcriptional regulator
MHQAMEAMVERLTRLGFSLYEAKAYVGLLINGEQTGYGLSNLTGVPQPKVYETLRRLLERGAVLQTAEKPATYAAIPAEHLLNTLDADFKQRLQEAKHDLEQLLPQFTEDQREVIWKLTSFEGVIAKAVSALAHATTTVYLSGNTTVLEPLKEAVAQASQRGVTFVVLHFGSLPFPVPNGRTFRHASTEGSLYSHHQARHLAVVVDSAVALWALARDGKSWQGLFSESATFASVIKGYIRHDIMVQRIYADLPEALTDLYGPGLLELAKISSPLDKGWDDEESAGEALTG